MKILSIFIAILFLSIGVYAKPKAKLVDNNRKPNSDGYIYRWSNATDKLSGIIALVGIDSSGLFVSQSGLTFSVLCEEESYGDALVWKTTASTSSGPSKYAILYEMNRTFCKKIKDHSIGMSAEAKAYIIIKDGKILMTSETLQ